MSDDVVTRHPGREFVRTGSADIPRVIDRSGHTLSRREIPENVLKVLYRLHRSGHTAYLCGGSVRDLLIGRKPKDFDVATSAHPNEVRRVFRNSRIIGRRFRLVHVVFQDDVVEVSTFRREPESRPDDEELLVTDDNVFGSPLQDARRRDFTVNGLFYNIADFSVIDFVGGLDDIEQKTIRVIGDPDLRFREDPVRMLRAIEFASRLGFEIEHESWEAIVRHSREIVKASTPRVSEEILELLRRGCSHDAFRLFLRSGLLSVLMPELAILLERSASEYFWTMMTVLDRTIRSGRRVSDPVLLSILFLPVILDEIEKDELRRGSRMKLTEVMLFIRESLQPFFQRMALSAGTRHLVEQAVESLWRLLEPPADRKGMWRFVMREPFSDALALLELFALSSGRHVESLKLWRAFALKVRQTEGADVVAPRRRKRRR